MRFENVSIASIAHIDADERVSSSSIEKRLETTLRRLHIPTGTLEMLTGIKARRMWPVEVQPSNAAARAAKLAIAASGVDRERLGVLVSTSVCRDFVEPSTACRVHGTLGLTSSCVHFDVGNACLGFLTGMDLVGNMIEHGQIEFGIVVGGENSRPVVDATIERLRRDDATDTDFRDEFATLTLGSGAAAMVLGRSTLVRDGHRYVGGVTLAASEHRDLCQGTAERMITNAPGLLAAGVDLAERTFAQAKTDLGWDVETIDEVVLHQVSHAHTRQLTSRLGVDMAKVLETYPELGNVGSAGVPIALSMAAQAGRIERGARVALMGIGSGLNCTMAEVVW